MIDTLTERHVLPMMAPAAILTGIGRVHSNMFPTSFFRFAGQFTEEFRPRGILNALSEAVVVRHAVDMQVLDAYDAKAIYHPLAFLMTKVITSKPDALMDAGNHLAVLTSFGRPFGKLGMFALHFSQGVLFLAKAAGVSNFVTIRTATFCKTCE
jgi:hypothetical protein